MNEGLVEDVTEGSRQASMTQLDARARRSAVRRRFKQWRRAFVGVSERAIGIKGTARLPSFIAIRSK